MHKAEEYLQRYEKERLFIIARKEEEKLRKEDENGRAKENEAVERQTSLFKDSSENAYLQR